MYRLREGELERFVVEPDIRGSYRVFEGMPVLVVGRYRGGGDSSSTAPAL